MSYKRQIREPLGQRLLIQKPWNKCYLHTAKLTSAKQKEHHTPPCHSMICLDTMGSLSLGIKFLAATSHLTSMCPHHQTPTPTPTKPSGPQQIHGHSTYFQRVNGGVQEMAWMHHHLTVRLPPWHLQIHAQGSSQKRQPQTNSTEILRNTCHALHLCSITVSGQTYPHVQQV